MATTIKWIDNNGIETAHRIYKSSTYFTKDNLPAPLVELGPDVTEYVDSAGTDGENWYIVSALLNDYEVFSEPFISGLTTAYIHDIFGDGSAVATYNFDGDATDLGGTYDGIETASITYSNNGIFRQSLLSSSSSYLNIGDNFNLGTSSWSFSVWVNITQYSPTFGSIFAKSKSSTPTHRYGLVVIDTGELRIILDNGLTSQDTNVGFIDLNTWVHLVWVIDRDNASFIYQNSVLYPYTLPTIPSSTNSNTSYNFLIGCYDAGSYPFNGMIEQLRIFNRALTQAEVNTLYQEGAQYL